MRSSFSVFHMDMVLIIEDDPAFRGFVRNTLAVQRYDVREAENGQQGIGYRLEIRDEST